MVEESLIPTPENPVDITLAGVESHAVYEIWVDGTIEKSTAMGASIDAEDTIIEASDGTMKAEGVTGPNGRDSYRVTGYVRQMALARQFWPENVSNFFVNGTELDNPYDIVVPEDALSAEVTEFSCTAATIAIQPSSASLTIQAELAANVEGQRKTATVSSTASGTTSFTPGDFGSQYEGWVFTAIRATDNMGELRAEDTQAASACLSAPEPEPPDEPPEEPPEEPPTDEPPSDGDGGGIGPGAAAAGLAALILLGDDDEED